MKYLIGDVKSKVFIELMQIFNGKMKTTNCKITDNGDVTIN